MIELPPVHRKLALLSLLYFVQGLPFGFQATALPVLLRQQGVSLPAIGLLSLLSLPWSLKVFAAPLVDRFGIATFGRRKTWIVPLQVGLAVSCFAAAAVALPDGLRTLLALTLAMNAFAATMDIAVDGAAVDMLGPKDLGGGNAAQVVGYKAGLLTGGGLLVWASGHVGWRGLFLSMGGLVLVGVLGALVWQERAAPASEATKERMSLRDVLALLVAAARAPGALLVFAIVGSYKIGELMVEVMFKPFLVDHGVAPADIGAWVGTYGMLGSILGSLVGGWLATRFRPITAVWLTALLRVLPLAAQVSLAFGTPVSAATVIPIVSVEHFVHGALTTAMFAFMMEKVDRRIGATHYTLLATLEVVGKSPGAWASGFVAKAWGYGATFTLGLVLSLVCLPWMFRAARQPERTTG
jgi:PAT family beta-lactamase induction signal transducer AmpG